VFRKLRGTYAVQAGDQIVACTLSSKLHKQLETWWENSHAPGLHRRVKAVHKITETDPVAVGDRVQFVPAPDGSGVIVQVLPRRNTFSRSAAGHGNLEQIIVANVDQVIPVFAIRQPNPKWRQLDRYLAVAEASEIPALVCITKTDLAQEQDRLSQIVSIYEGIGYRVIPTSTVTGEGVRNLAQALHGRISAVVGKSGVGKTSLLNCIQPGLGLPTRAVSRATGKGKHTTSHLEIYKLDGGGGVIDTPGTREFDLWHHPEDGGLAHLYVEMQPYIGKCRFGLDCLHRQEPGCAVREAVAAGEITQMRYDSYLHTLRHMPGMR